MQGIRAALCALAALAALARAEERGAWKPAASPLMTRWAKDVRPDNVWPEYPRPQMVRQEWQNLNGLWEYSVAPAAQAEAPGAYDGAILVPFCIESALSGVKRSVRDDEALWYRRTFETPGAWNGQRVLLHFGAVDWSAEVWVNGKRAGGHRGGYDPFSLDITELLTAKGAQTLVVRVTDPTDSSWQPRGKQVRDPRGIWYTAVTGIWQTVWLEPVPTAHIRSLRITPDVDRSEVTVAADVAGGGTLRVDVLEGEREVARGEASTGTAVKIAISGAKLWSPDSPHLYGLRVRLTDGDTELDAVRSYFGMRKIALGASGGHTRILLNGEPVFQYGPLDQGWWPDGLYTPATDEALRYDLEVLTRLGMNMLRKHVKVEPARLYYHCDVLGLLVWQDMPSGDAYIGDRDPDIARSRESGENFERELKAMIDHLRNHPSIILWVVYNEGWGQWDTPRVTEWVRQYDPTRLVNSASGWTDRGVGDVIDVHVYPGPGMRPPEARRASVLGEFGGLGWPVEGRLWQNKENWGYRTYTSQAELQRHYEEVVSGLVPLIAQGLSAAVYTQTSDVEGEVNGLMTYDREILKLDGDRAAAVHRQLYQPPLEIRHIVPTSIDAPQSWRYTLEEPADRWMKPEFDDSNWASGDGMFGADGTPGVRVGTRWDTPGIWMRREFELGEVPSGDLYLNIFHDEDAEVYLNGVPAGSFEHWVVAHRLAPASPDARAALKRGRNTIAVHCRQTSGGQGIDVGLSVLVRSAE